MPSVQLMSAEAFTPTQTAPRWDYIKDPKEPLALDIDFQEFRHKDSVKWGHRIGRIAIVNTRGQTVYDTYVRYENEDDVSVKMPPRCFGVTWKDIKTANGAKMIWEVEPILHKIMSGRTIIGHGMRLDIKAIKEKIWEGADQIRDTQDMYGQVKLEYLAADYLGESIQQGEHHPTEDAVATMGWYLRPYNGRKSFKDADFKLDDDDFPALGGPVKKSK